MKTPRVWAVLVAVVYLVVIVSVNSYAIFFESSSSEIGLAFVTTLWLGVPWIFASAPLDNLSPGPPVWAFWLIVIAADLINWGLVTFVFLRMTRKAKAAHVN